MAAGVDLTVTLDARTMAVIEGALARLGSEGIERMTAGIGTLVERQTKDRITDEKTAPDGTPWAPWSARYAATRNTGSRRANSLLIDSENLLESIQDYSAGDTVRVGTRTPYSAIQQFGGRGIPARPYLGLSDANRREIEELAIDIAQAVLA